MWWAIDIAVFWGLIIGLWSVLFVVAQGPGEMFGWLQSFYGRFLPDWLSKPFWCAKCHALWLGLGLGYFYFDLPLKFTIACAVIASFTAYFITEKIPNG
jgi:hypothetical protein